MKSLLFLLLIITISSNIIAQNVSGKGLQAISSETIEAPLSFLASDWTEGREVGTRGAYMAADYIAGIFQMYGIKPLGDMAIKRLSREPRMRGAKPEKYRSYFQNFDLVTGPRKAETELYLKTITDFSLHEKKLTEGTDYQLHGTFETMKLDAPVVFLGYGIKSTDLKCDPFSKSNVKGKIAFILSGFPGINDKDSVNYNILIKNNNSTLGKLESEKIKNAQEAGAIAVVKYNPNNVLKAGNTSNHPEHFDNEYYEGDLKQDDFYLKKIALPNKGNNNSIPVININKSLTESILTEYDELLLSMQKSDYNMSSFKPKELSGYRFNLQIKRDNKVIRARNVLGYIEGEDTTEAIVIGGHYDHVGKYNGYIFNGADDNVSGTVGMLTLARAFIESGTKPAKTLVFAGWTAEEQGLWGSKYFVNNIPDSLDIILNINLDMIGRTYIADSTDNYLSIHYTKGYEKFEQMFNESNEINKLNLDIRYKSDKQPKGGSDFTPFAKKGVPIISITTGLHKDYHMPNDEVEFINIDKMTDIVKLTYLGLDEILNSKILE
jgi:hypothetical protein